MMHFIHYCVQETTAAGPAERGAVGSVGGVAGTSDTKSSNHLSLSV